MPSIPLPGQQSRCMFTLLSAGVLHQFLVPVDRQ
jgi:hypothetical protein